MTILAHLVLWASLGFMLSEAAFRGDGVGWRIAAEVGFATSAALIGFMISLICVVRYWVG